MTEVLRVIHLFQTDENSKKYELKLANLKQEAKENRKHSNKSIDKLIRKDLITVEMASSLFNDYSNVNDIIKKLIEVAELLYSSKKDTLFENGNFMDKKRALNSALFKLLFLFVFQYFSINIINNTFRDIL